MQNFGVTNKEHYGMLWYFWSGQLSYCPDLQASAGKSATIAAGKGQFRQLKS